VYPQKGAKCNDSKTTAIKTEEYTLAIKKAKRSKPKAKIRATKKNKKIKM
jgi:hypothetical protein